MRGFGLPQLHRHAPAVAAAGVTLCLVALASQGVGHGGAATERAPGGVAAAEGAAGRAAVSSDGAGAVRDVAARPVDPAMEASVSGTAVLRRQLGSEALRVAAEAAHGAVGSPRGRAAPALGLPGFDASGGPRREESGPPETAEDFWAWDFARGAEYRASAWLAYANDDAWVYVEEGRTADPAATASLADLFADSIAPEERALFGGEPMPGIDGLHALTIVLLDIPDRAATGEAPHVAGYFNPLNEVPQSDLDARLPGRHSNEREMVYLDLNPEEPVGLPARQSLAHEFQHLIQWNHDPQEAPWLDEGLSDLAVYLVGLGHPEGHLRAYLAAPERTLVSDMTEPADYGFAYLFLLFNVERERDLAWLRALEARPDHGLDSLGAVLTAPVDTRFTQLALALVHDDPLLGDGRYGLRALDLGSAAAEGWPAPAAHTDGGAGAFEAEVGAWSIRTDALVPTPAGLVVEIRPGRAACPALSVRAAMPATHPGVLADMQCRGAGASSGWALPRPVSGAKLIARAVLANPSGEPLLATYDLEAPAALAATGRALLPLTGTRAH